MRSKIEYLDGGKVSIDGVIFHKEKWEEMPSLRNPLFDALGDPKNKHGVGQSFKRMIQNDPKVRNLEYHKRDAVVIKKMAKLGFERKEGYSRYPYNRWVHPLKMAELKDLFIQTYTPLFKDEITALEQFNEDGKNRKIFIKKVNLFWDFEKLFLERMKSYKEDIKNIEQSIGQGNYGYLANECDNYGGQLYPSEALVNSFVKLSYAKEWLTIFEPVIYELQRVGGSLRVPSRFDDRTRDREHNIVSIAEFKYQDWLTFLLDFRLRLGRHCKGGALSGWRINSYRSGEYHRWDTGAQNWDPFNEKYYSGRYDKTTMNDVLFEMVLNGDVETLKDGGLMSRLVSVANTQRHAQNKNGGRYECVPFVQVGAIHHTTTTDSGKTIILDKHQVEAKK